MSVNKLIFSLLLKIDQTINEIGTETARTELSKLICHILEADGCAVYVYNPAKDIFSLARDYSFVKDSDIAASWYPYERSLLNSSEYSEKPKLTTFFSEGGSLQPRLILPLKSEKQNAGVVLIDWNNSSPFADLSPEDLQLWQIISQMLATVYYVYPLLREFEQREKDLTILYLKAEKDLEDSRRQVSLELHDEVGQVLTSILLQLKLLQKSDDLDYIKGRLGGLHHITLETLEEVRRISQNLRPNLLEKLGLKAAIEAHANEFMQTTGIAVELRTHNLDKRVSETLGNIVYRAVQEGLTNAARHSGAGKVIISLTIKGNNLFLQILDHGRGMKKSDKYGTGLLGMKERVTGARGKFWLVNKADRGLTINILLPLQ